MAENGKSRELPDSLMALLMRDERVGKLLTALITGRIVEIKPEFDFNREPGFSYPQIEEITGITEGEVASMLDLLVGEGIVTKDVFDRLLRCPQCQSINLRPTIHCPKCGSGNIARGRVFEHFICKYVGLEDEFMTTGRYVCPQCHGELRTVGSDYQSLGLMRKCRGCGEIFSSAAVKWRCLQCTAVTTEDKVGEIDIYAYRFNEAKREWLEFEHKSKRRLVDFLRERGYQVGEKAMVRGRSGAEHYIDVLATRDDGIVTHRIAIAIEVEKEPIALGRVFAFDDKAYDLGIHDKVIVVDAGLSKEAETFVAHQRIRVFGTSDLETVLSEAAPPPGEEMEEVKFEFESRAQLTEFLRGRGYQVSEKAVVSGRSGAEHDIDILATRDDGIVTHQIAIGIEVASEPVALNKVFAFDDKAYDAGIQDKVFIAVPGLSPEARQFADRQRIRVFEVKELEQSD